MCKEIKVKREWVESEGHIISGEERVKLAIPGEVEVTQNAEQTGYVIRDEEFISEIPLGLCVGYMTEHPLYVNLGFSWENPDFYPILNEAYTVTLAFPENTTYSLEIVD